MLGTPGGTAAAGAAAVPAPGSALGAEDVAQPATARAAQATTAMRLRVRNMPNLLGQMDALGDFSLPPGCPPGRGPGLPTLTPASYRDNSAALMERFVANSGSDACDELTLCRLQRAEFSYRRPSAPGTGAAENARTRRDRRQDDLRSPVDVHQRHRPALRRRQRHRASDGRQAQGAAAAVARRHVDDTQNVSVRRRGRRAARVQRDRTRISQPSGSQCAVPGLARSQLLGRHPKRNLYGPEHVATGKGRRDEFDPTTPRRLAAIPSAQGSVRRLECVSYGRSSAVEYDYDRGSLARRRRCRLHLQVSQACRRLSDRKPGRRQPERRYGRVAFGLTADAAAARLRLWQRTGFVCQLRHDGPRLDDLGFCRSANRRGRRQAAVFQIAPALYRQAVSRAAELSRLSDHGLRYAARRQRRSRLCTHLVVYLRVGVI